MERMAFLLGWMILACGGVAAVACAILGACILFRFAIREARANVDLWRAISEWKRNHPDKAARYEDA